MTVLIWDLRNFASGLEDSPCSSWQCLFSCEPLAFVLDLPNEIKKHLLVDLHGLLM